MTLFLNEAEVGQVATMEMALEAVEEAFHGLGQGQAQVRPRQRIELSSGSLHTLVGGVPSSRALGLKTYTVYGAPRSKLTRAPWSSSARAVMESPKTYSTSSRVAS